jgi:hypothetical protein
MNTRTIKAGTIDVSVVISIIDSTDGTPEVGVVYNTSGIDLQYRRELAASVAITEVTLAALTTAHSDGGFLHIGNGYYRLDLPDAACAAGATGVLVHGTVTGMVVIGCYVELVAYDPYAATLGLSIPTAIENADALLDRNMATGTDSGSPTVRTPRQALRAVRNKWGFPAGVYTVYKEDDSTVSWTGTPTTDAAGLPIIGNDPAGP